MSAPINEGGPAFPTTFSVDAHGRCVGIHDSTAHIESVAGMTLRDWFAGQALDLASKLEHDKPTGSEGQPTYTGIATRAYYMADAMLCARGQG